MQFVRTTKSRAPKLALTSMLDVIFLLLCFFVTASVFSQWESEISIKLPSASTAMEPSRLPGEIILNLTKEGTVKINGNAVALPALELRLAKVAKFYKDQPVIIRADRDTPYQKLVDVVDTCRAANIWNFSLATEGEMK